MLHGCLGSCSIRTARQHNKCLNKAAKRHGYSNAPEGTQSSLGRIATGRRARCFPSGGPSLRRPQERGLLGGHKSRTRNRGAPSRAPNETASSAYTVRKLENNGRAGGGGNEISFLRPRVVNHFHLAAELLIDPSLSEKKSSSSGQRKVLF